MGRSHGAGIPITLKCSKCKLSRVRTLDDPMGVHTNAECGDLVQTGRRRPLYGQARTRGGARLLSDQHQYRCRACGFVGWTRLKDILRKPWDTKFHVRLKS